MHLQGEGANAPRQTGFRRFSSVATLAASLLLTATSLFAQDISQQAYLKASNADSGDEFASAISLSGDTLVVGAPTEDSASIESDNSASAAGAVYVFTRNAGVWTQQAYLKASNIEAGDRFGQSVAIDGDTLIIGANGEDGASNSASGSGAAYIFTRSAGVWTEQAYLKASNLEAGDSFGTSVTISGDTAAVGAISEDSDGTPTNNNALSSGAAYVFTRNAGVWTQQAYLKASTPRASDQFGISVSIAGETLVIGANQEDGTASNSGAAYVFTRSAGAWAQEAYLKASNAGASDQFGFAVSITGDLIAVSAPQEASNAVGIDGSQTNNTATGAGAVYLFRRDAGTWSQEAYVKASNTAASDTFGQSIALRGEVLAVGAMGEDSNATGFNGSQTNNIATNSGAAYIFEKIEGTWSQQAYLKASNTAASAQFGRSITLSGRTAVVGANLEDSSAGAAYAFIDVGTIGAEPELDVEQPLGELVADEGSVVDYGLVAVGAPAVTKTFHLFNRGTADLLISSVTADGDFVVNTSAMDNTVAADGSTTFTVSFTPSQLGQRTTTLIIESNDTDESPYEIILTGAALPEIAITGNTINIVDGDTLPAAADHTDFGIAAIEGGTRSRVFRITNTGVADLTIDTITVSGDFAVTSPPTSPVAPGGFTTFEITFDPTLIGLRSGEVSLSNNDGNENPFTFAIQGLGTGPGLTDTTFGTNGRTITDFYGTDERARALVIQSDGKIVVAGYADNGLDTDIAAARYLTDGSLDLSFGSNGIATTPIGMSFDEATGIALQNDGKIVVCGFAYNGSNDDFVVLRYLTDGTLDTSFGGDGIVTTTMGGSDDRAYGVVVQSDGRIVLVGSAYNGSNADVALVRYLANGSLDASFGSGGKVTTAIGSNDDLGYAIALQRDGKLVVTGQADNGISDDLILLRYNTNGSLDTAFGTNGKVVTPNGISNSAGFSVTVRRNGQIFVGGYTTNPTDTDWLVARYTSNGSLDTTYGTGGKVIAAVGSSYEEINSIVVQADGSVLATGFTRVGITDDIALMRFLPDGSVDTSFGTNGKVITALGTAGDYAFAMGVQTDGLIVVTGHTNNGNNDDIALVRYIANPVVLPPKIIVEDAANLELPGGSTIDFGSVIVGTTSSAVTVGIVNDGTEPLNLSAVTKVGAFAADYTVDVSSMSTTLAAGASTSFTVVFAPTELGDRNIQLTINSNDSVVPIFELQLKGIGTILFKTEIAVSGVWLDSSNDFPVQGSLYRPMPGVINQDGYVSFKAMGTVDSGGITAGNDALLLTSYSINGLQVIGQEGMWLPASGSLSGTFNNLILTATGRTSSFEQFVGATTASDHGYLISGNGGTLELLSREGDTATGGGIFIGHTGRHAADDNERIYFPGTLSGALITKNSGVWYDEAGTISILAKEGQNVSSYTGDQAWLGNFSVPLSAAGDGAAFIAALQNNPDNTTQITPLALNAGLFSGAADSLELVARKGDFFPGLGKLGTFSAVSRASNGDHAFISLLTLSTVGPVVSTLNDQVLMTEIAGVKHLVARENVTDIIDGLKPIRFGNFYMTTAGEVIYQVWLVGSGVTTTNDSALCRWTMAGGHVVLAREGSLAPGTGLNYGTFQVFSVSPGGAIVLQSTLSSGIALMGALPGASLNSVVRTGTILVVDGVNRGILSLGIHQTGAGTGGGGGGMGAAINDDGVIFTVLSIGNSQYVARIYRP